MWGRTNIAGDVYFGQLMISSIDLDSTGEYEFSYFVAMSCDGAECEDSGDSIILHLSDDQDETLKISDVLGTELFQRRWYKLTFRFSAVNSTIINVRK